MQVCSQNNCEEPSRSRGLCRRHYNTITMAERRGGYVKVGDFCKKGHKIIDNNIQRYMNHGVERVRCAQCSRNTPNKKTKMGDTCANGHKIEGENAIWLKVSKGDDKRLRCRTCYDVKNKRNRVLSLEQRKFNRRLGRFRKEFEEQKKKDSLEKILSIQPATNSSYGNLNYLKMSKRAEMVWQPLYKAFENNRSFCYKSPEEYIDYDEENPPSKSHAYELCDGCPILVECGRFANAYKPIIGVWGGEVWKDGKVMR